MKSYRLIKEYFMERIWVVTAGVLCLMIVDVVQLFIPRIIKRAVDDMTAYRATRESLLEYAAYILLAALIICVLRYFWRRFLIGTSRRVEEGLRNRLFRHIQILSASYFDQTRTGDLMAHVTNDIANVRMATGMGIVAATDAVFLGTAAIGFMCHINFQLTVFALIPMPLIAFSAKYFSKRMHTRYRETQGAFADMTEVVRERYAGIRIIKSYNLEEDSRQRVEEISRRYIRENLSLVRITGAFFPMMLLFTNLSLAIVIVFGGRLAILTTISPGDFVAFINYLNLMTWPMMALGWVTNLLQRGAASLDRIDVILQTPAEIRQPRNPVSGHPARGAIQFQDVSYSYDDNREPVLSGITFTVNPGETLGIVGPPGSGKTTLLNMIPRLYDVCDGFIRIHGTDIRQWDLEELRDSISFVAQEPFLFSGTIGENIRFGNPDADDEKVMQAAKLASFDDSVKALPAGLNTIVGEKGVILSGGQKQRLALARAFIRRSKVLLLDDPVSQVDMDTGRRIIETIRLLEGQQTVIIVSHRLSALRHADQILVMESGRIKIIGTHEQLMASDDYYARTFRLQEMEEANHAF
ncbi:MAG: ABC transporter ATP-binding protein [Desulfobacteraceae bacterium]|nr:MAG: ABC transporter ATP-binding protein [Desulfobacteraceae bacterium]